MKIRVVHQPERRRGNVRQRVHSVLLRRPAHRQKPPEGIHGAEATEFRFHRDVSRDISVREGKSREKQMVDHEIFQPLPPEGILSIKIRLCAAILESGTVRVLRDPTRGGVATTLNEFVEGTELGIELRESAVPVRGEVQAACDMLGLDPMYCANEGKLLAVVPPEDAENVLAAMRAHEFGRGAAVIGEVSAKYAGKVVMHTELGGSRIMQKLTGAQLPRIC